MGDWTNIQAKDGEFRAYVAKPEGQPKGAIVVIQEIFGVNAVMRHKCDWLAGEGFWALAPDLFWRIQPGIDITDRTEAEWSQAFDYFNRFDAVAGVADIQTTIDAARGQMEGNKGAKKVGTVGYCLGGLLAYLCATRTDTDASVGYYGVNIPKFLDEAVKIQKPLMLHIAGKDGFVKAEAQAAMHKGLDGNPLVTLHDYPERDHAFTREGGKNYDATDAKIADDRTLAFFTHNLA